MMEPAPLLEVKDLTVQHAGTPVLEGISFSISEGEKLAVIGGSGSGKTTLIRTLAGKYFTRGSVQFAGQPKIVTITQQHHFRNLSNLSSFYYQQRFNSADADDALTVNEALLQLGATREDIDAVLQKLGISGVKHTRLIQLSNGEHKRVQLAKALLRKADWLLLDSPYTGLDVAARKMLNAILDELSASGIQYLLVTSPSDIPSGITHVAELKAGRITSLVRREEYKADRALKAGADHTDEQPSFTHIPFAYPDTDFGVAIRMKNTSVEYNGRRVLDNINWEVKKGERWSVSGHNGSGKSTLLSLVNGDNPQAFANDIVLFDRKKGSGETIWDIKKKIGYVSPELHHYFESGSNCYEVVASGLFDTIGLFRQPDRRQVQLVDAWMETLGLAGFKKRLFKQLSNGEQRLVLLARALVKNPPMLILDEPCQGLDSETAGRFVKLVDAICVQLNKTLVYVSHYDAEIPSCVTYTLKLEQGKTAA